MQVRVSQFGGNMIRKICVAYLAVLFLLGCSSQKISLEQPAPADNNIEEYVIGVSDQLYVDVWKVEELTMSVPVRPDGNISLPLIGDIAAKGLTAKQLAINITKNLETYIRSPQVTVIVTSAESVDYMMRVRVTGAVNNPISIPYKDGMTVLDLVLEAGGLNVYASPNKAKLYRKVSGQVKVYPVRLNDILHKGELSTNYTLYPSDIVTVPERIF